MIQGCGSGADAGAAAVAGLVADEAGLAGVAGFAVGGLGACGGSESREGQEKDKAIHGEKRLRLNSKSEFIRREGRGIGGTSLNTRRAPSLRDS